MPRLSVGRPTGGKGSKHNHFLLVRETMPLSEAVTRQFTAARFGSKALNKHTK